MLLFFYVRQSYTPIYCFQLRNLKALSLSMISIKRVNAMSLLDLCASDFVVALKIIIIAELFIVITALPC